MVVAVASLTWFYLDLADSTKQKKQGSYLNSHSSVFVTATTPFTASIAEVDKNQLNCSLKSEKCFWD